MALDRRPSGGKVSNEWEQLKFCAIDIERKFDQGRARDIKPYFIEGIIKLSVGLRKKTNNNGVKNHLADIEDTAYAVLDNAKAPDYYKNLRTLLRQLQSLGEFR